MADYIKLKDAITEVIKTNGNQEITGQILQNTLLSIVNVIGEDRTFAGVAELDTNPGNPDKTLFGRQLKRVHIPDSETMYMTV